MPDFKLTMEGNSVAINMKRIWTGVRRLEDNSGFALVLNCDGAEVVAHLANTELHILGLQCLAHMPEHSPRYTDAGVEEAFRLPARRLKHFDDRSMQTLLREISSDGLIDLLWYMADEELILQVLNNLSKRSAQLLMDDLNTRWHGKNPDLALECDAKRGRKAVLEIMEVVNRMVLEGELPDMLEQYS
ncbi:MAG: hypothetical protein H6999_10565 [Hahellaceae bacterium]|nr:hypothetical protein [Hahellaceae bacterium]MCP5170183.1 hypothetical protein [Hahellaceae bacterium]